MVNEPSESNLAEIRRLIEQGWPINVAIAKVYEEKNPPQSEPLAEGEKVPLKEHYPG